MMIRTSIVPLGIGLLVLASCDDRATPPPKSRATQPATSQAAADARRISLVAIPFTASVPDGWDVRAGPGDKLVLNGKTPEGDEVDVLLAQRQSIKADALPAMLERLAPTTASAVATDAGLLTRRVDDRDGMKVIEETERLGPPDQPADLAPYRWTIQYVVVGDGLSCPVYELNVTDLSPVTYERNKAFLRAVLDSVQYDSSRAPAAR